MFEKLFKKKTSEDGIYPQEVHKVDPIVAEIHSAVDSVEDNLLKQAYELINSKDLSKERLKKAERLKNLGFLSSTEVVSVKRDTDAVMNERELANLIVYYKSTYPFQKFLTLDSFEKICTKYGLTYMSVSRYKNDVPEKNLDEIEKAKPLKSSDSVKGLIYLHIIHPWSDREYADLIRGKKFECSFEDFSDVNNPTDSEVRRVLARTIPSFASTTGYIFSKAVIYKEDKSGLYIAAPRGDFDLIGVDDNLSEVGFVTRQVIAELTDPIVFRFCRGGIQVITKWGLEARDEALANEYEN